MRLDPPHDTADLRVTAPAVNMHRHPRLHLHRFGGQQFRHDLQVVRIAERQQRRACAHDPFTAFGQFQHRPCDRGRHRDHGRGPALELAQCQHAGLGHPNLLQRCAGPCLRRCQFIARGNAKIGGLLARLRRQEALAHQAVDPLPLALGLRIVLGSVPDPFQRLPMHRPRGGHPGPHLLLLPRT
ncbi:hypothetical protein D9M72_228510 [compost metagenome]